MRSGCALRDSLSSTLLMYPERTRQGAAPWSRGRSLALLLACCSALCVGSMLSVRVPCACLGPHESGSTVFVFERVWVFLKFFKLCVFAVKPYFLLRSSACPAGAVPAPVAVRPRSAAAGRGPGATYFNFARCTLHVCFIRFNPLPVPTTCMWSRRAACS